MEMDAKGDWIRYESAPSVFVPSDNELAEEGWPSQLYRYSLPQGNWYPSSTLATKISLPVFPNGMEAVQWWLQVNDITRSDIFGKVIVLLPNFRVRIRDVEIGSKQLAFSIERRHFAGNVLAKIHAKRPGSKPILIDQEVQGTEGKFELESDWNFLMLVVLDEESSEVLDQRTVYTTWGDLPKGVRWEAREEDLLEIIRRGETEEVEFKEDLTNRDDVLKTVVALANTNGGVLLIGVNDECQVVSFKESADVIEQKIRNWVRDGCEQPIQMEFQMRKVLNQDVMVIVVELSQDRPCWLREKGPFIRYGSNNRLASRAEVERMKDKPGLGSAVTYA
jgi:hypothetical protein